MNTVIVNTVLTQHFVAILLELIYILVTLDCAAPDIATIVTNLEVNALQAASSFRDLQVPEEHSLKWYFTW
jgi:hypothetical protein